MNKLLKWLLSAALVSFLFVACDNGNNIPDDSGDDTETMDPVTYTVDFNSGSSVQDFYGSTAGTWGGDASGTLSIDTVGTADSAALKLVVNGNSDADGTGKFWAWTNNPLVDGGFVGDQVQDQISGVAVAEVTLQANVTGVTDGGHVWLQFKPIASSGGAPEYSDIEDAGVVTLSPIEFTADTTGFVEQTVTVPMGDIMGDGTLYNALVLSYEVTTDADSATTIIIDDLNVEFLQEEVTSYAVDFDAVADVTAAYGSTQGTWGGDAAGELTLEATAGVGGTPALQLAVTGNADADGTGMFWAWTNNPVQDGGFSGDQATVQDVDAARAQVRFKAKVSGIPTGADTPRVLVQFKPITASGGAPEYTDIDNAGVVSLDPVEITADSADFVDYELTVPFGDILGDGTLYNALVLSFGVATAADSATTIIIDDIEVDYEYTTEANADFDTAVLVSDLYGDTYGSWGGDAAGSVSFENIDTGDKALKISVEGNADADGTGKFWVWSNNPVQNGGFIGEQAAVQLADAQEAEVSVFVKATGITDGGHVWLQFKPISSEGGAPEYTDLEAAGTVLAAIEITEDTTGFEEKTITVPLGDVLGTGTMYQAIALSFEITTDADSMTTVLVDDISVTFE